jgi:hypothetical protein
MITENILLIDVMYGLNANSRNHEQIPGSEKLEMRATRIGKQIPEDKAEMQAPGIDKQIPGGLNYFCGGVELGGIFELLFHFALLSRQD